MIKFILFIVFSILLYGAFGYATAMTVFAIDDYDVNDESEVLIIIIIGWPIILIMGLAIFIFKCIIKPLGKLLSIIPVTIVALIKSKGDQNDGGSS